ncbi:hypothetical protein C8F04DRAFT_977668, partial [Mycena alexandri]
MLKTLKKYGIQFDTLNPSQEIQGALPLWHHTGEDPGKVQYHNTAAANCLRLNHGVLLVRQGMEVLQRLEDKSHKQSNRCRCLACNSDRRSHGCEHPHSCTEQVERTLSRLLPKWDPRGNDNQIGLT